MPRLAAVVLAAGRGTRLGAADGSKLLCRNAGGRSMLAAVLAALEGLDGPVVVVTGHAADAVAAEAAACCPDCAILHNPAHAEGLASSLRAGLAAVPGDCDGALIALADMPRLRADHIRALAGAFGTAQGQAIIAPTSGGRRGNPVIWPRDLLAGLATVTGDQGGRVLLDRHAGRLHLVPLDGTADGGAGVLFDVDTPDALADWQGSTAGG